MEVGVATYFLMGVPFIVLVIVLDIWILKTKVIATKQCWVVMMVMVVLTAIFDQFLTGLPIVHYNEANMTGVRLLYAPIEDFTYTFAAVIGLGSLLQYAETKSNT